jgi:hypothetical protein
MAIPFPPNGDRGLPAPMVIMSKKDVTRILNGRQAFFATWPGKIVFADNPVNL